MSRKQDAIIGLWVDGAIETGEMKRRLHHIGVLTGLRRAARLMRDAPAPWWWDEHNRTRVCWGDAADACGIAIRAEARRVAKKAKP